LAVLVSLLEDAGDTPEGDQAEDDVLVLASVSVTPALAVSELQRGLEIQVGSAARVDVKCIRATAQAPDFVGTSSASGPGLRVSAHLS
jgi:hypothetical protein